MKREQRIFIALEAALALAACLVVAHIVLEKYNTEKEKIVVALEDSENGRWSALKYGMKTAAKDCGIDYIVVEEQENDDNQSDLTLLEPDYEQLGRTLAEEIVRDFDGKLTNKTIGIVKTKELSKQMKPCEQAFAEVIMEAGGKILWSSDVEDHGNVERTIRENWRVDIVAALDDKNFIEAGKLSETHDLRGSILYGIADSVEAVYYVDRKNAECIVVPDDFSIGYESVSKYAGKKYKNQEIGYFVLRRDNMFEKKNQDLIYAMSQ